MKACTLALLAAPVFLAPLFLAPMLRASDHLALTNAVQAQLDFDRVANVVRPRIPDAGVCMQSQAAALAVSPPEDRSLLYYRKGYCAFAGAAATQDASQYRAAAEDFGKAIEAWPARAARNAKHAPPEPVAPALRVFAGVARLHATSLASTETAGDTGPVTAGGTAGAAANTGANTGANTESALGAAAARQEIAAAAARQEIAAALESPSCDSNLMPATFCADVLSAGAQWLGWLALRGNQLDEAARKFAGAPASGWSDWVQGRREFESANFRAAATQYAAAIDAWKRIWQGDGPTLRQALGPRPQLAPALADWGGARMLAGDLPGAIRTLDSAIQADPASPHALFLRARTRELAGQPDAALADYNLASRTAFAAAQDLASGEAHIYRGIVLYRRRDFARAEEEFSSAMNFEMNPALRPDARAWRHMSAVAGGSCGAARQALRLALTATSPFFPKDEARALAASCDATAGQ